jgi:hypothetical protein
MPSLLTTLANVREYLKFAATDTSRDALLTNLVKRSGALLEKYMGRTVLAASYTEYYDGDGRTKLLLNQWPINSVAELNMDNSRIFAAATIIQASDFVIWKEVGYLELLKPLDYLSGIETAYGRFFIHGQQNLKVTYNAGYTVVPDDIEQASIIHVAYLYNKAGSEGHISMSLGGLAKSYDRRAIPDEVAMYLEPYRKRPV